MRESPSSKVSQPRSLLAQREECRPRPPASKTGDVGLALQRLVKENASFAYFVAAVRVGSPAALSVSENVF